MGDGVSSMGDGVASMSDGIVITYIFITLILMLLICQYDLIGDINLVIIITIIDLL